MSCMSFVGANDTILVDIISDAENTTMCREFYRAGPRGLLAFHPRNMVRACIVTCGGLCPGLNSVIRELVITLSLLYGGQNISGIPYGYRGFYSTHLKLIPLTEDKVQSIHHDGGSILGYSRGGHNTKMICDSIQITGFNQMYIIVGLSESILDVLVAFALPPDAKSVSVEVRRAAIQVQLLRSYRAYEVSNLTMSVGSGLLNCSALTAEWQFRFVKAEHTAPVSVVRSMKGTGNGQLQVPKGISSFDSADNLSYANGGTSDKSESEPYRRGLMAAFDNWSSMEAEFDMILEQHANSAKEVQPRNVNVMTVLLRWDESAPGNTTDTAKYKESSKEGKQTGRNDTLRDPLVSEVLVSQSLSAFCRAKASRMELSSRAGLKTISFIVAPTPSSESVTYPGFYTFRVQDNFNEDPIFRHIDPPMAFQLELSRLSNFSITRFDYPTRSVHVFFAQDKSTTRNKRSEDSSKSAKRPLSMKVSLMAPVRSEPDNICILGHPGQSLQIVCKAGNQPQGCQMRRNQLDLIGISMQEFLSELLSDWLISLPLQMLVPLYRSPTRKELLSRL